MSAKRSKERWLDTCAFGVTLARHITEDKKIKAQLKDYGQAIVQQLCGPFGNETLRGVARATKLSPTYLSHVLNGKVTVSRGAYIKLACHLEKRFGRSQIAQGGRCAF